MHPTLDRRRFLTACGLSVAGGMFTPHGLRAVEPFTRKGPARLQLSLAAYSFREFFATSKGKPVEGAKRTLDLFQFVDFCAEHGCVGTELTSYYFPADTNREFLLKLRRHAFLRGVAVSGTSVGNTFTHPAGDKRDAEMKLVKTWIENAAVLGAPHIRVFAGAAQRGQSADEARRLCIEAMEECAEHAGRHGIFLGVENHGGIVAEPDGLLEIIRAVKSPWVGINLDTGNFHGDDPYAEVARCLPYAVNVQTKAEIRRRNSKNEPADLARLVKLFRDGGYQGYVALEYESAEDPWKAVPPLLKQLRELIDKA